MSKRPILFGLTAATILCLGLAAIDAVTILARPLLPWFAWMFP